ncbi:hypothetical protein HDU76_012976, partial [Blyttiomyces sp. JEL0837]
MMQTAESLYTASSDVQPRCRFTIPAVVILVSCMLASLAAVTTPLGVTVINNSNSITDILATQIIQNVLNQTLGGLTSFFSGFTDEAVLFAGDPGITDALADIDTISDNKRNIIIAALNTFRRNPSITAMSCWLPTPNTTRPPVMIGITNQRCSKSSSELVSDKCASRVYRNATAFDVTYEISIDNTTGADVDGIFNILSAGDFINISTPEFSNIYNPEYKMWEMRFEIPYEPKEESSTNLKSSSRRICRASIEMESKMNSFLISLKPTVGSIVYLVDDAGFMAASSVSESTVANETFRYTASNNIDPLISSSGNKFVEEYGSIEAVPDGYFKTVALDGALYILASNDFKMPFSLQKYKVVVVIPRLDFYGSTEQSTHKALILVAILSCVGVTFVAGLSFLAILPLKKMESSMRQLTKFDFSVLEQGKLESTSFVLEYNIVETTFLKMVK